MEMRGVESRASRTCNPPFVKKYLDENREKEEMRRARFMLFGSECWCKFVSYGVMGESLVDGAFEP